MFYERITISPKELQITRQAFNIFDVARDVGGIAKALMYLAILFVKPFAKIDFKFKAIQELTDTKLEEPTFVQKLKLITKINPNED